MAKQITDNASKSPVAQEDILLVRDVTSNTDKKTTVAGVAPAVAANFPDGAISSKAISNPYKFRGYRTSSFTLTAGDFTKIPFDTESYDTGSNFDIATNKGRFTAPAAGFFHFDASILIDAAGSTVLWALLYKNGVFFSSGSRFGATVFGTSVGSTVSDTFPLAMNDFVEVYVFCNGAANLTMPNPSSYNYFSGHLVSKG